MFNPKRLFQLHVQFKTRTISDTTPEVLFVGIQIRACLFSMFSISICVIVNSLLSFQWNSVGMIVNDIVAVKEIIIIYLF